MYNIWNSCIASRCIATVNKVSHWYVEIKYTWALLPLHKEYPLIRIMYMSFGESCT